MSQPARIESPQTSPPIEDTLLLPGGVFVAFRPLAIEDDALYPALDARLSAEDRRFRFFSPSRLSARQIAKFKRFDRQAAAAIVAVQSPGGEIAGVARLHRGDDGAGEFALLVRSDLKRQGLGTALMERIIDQADEIGVRSITGHILRENTGMQRLARRLGFTLAGDPEDHTLTLARLAA